MYFRLTASLDISEPKLKVHFFAYLSYLSHQYAKCTEDWLGNVQLEIHMCVTLFTKYHW